MLRSIMTLALVCAPVLAAAQGTLSTQGFGYPTGGLSTRAAAAGGAFGEFDFSSARNPSAPLGWGRGGLYFQYEPELRRIAVGDGTDNTTTARFPVWMAAIQMGSRAMGTIASSTVLDRTWRTRVRGGQILGPDSVGYEETVESAGAINDVRLGAAVSLRPSLSVGVGVHAFTGENRMSLTRRFDDSLRYGTLERNLTIGYLGRAFSAGATWRVTTNLAIAASARAGGVLDLRIADTVLASGSMPSRFGAAVRFDGVPGASLAVSVERTAWSTLGDLAQTDLVANDAWELGVGLEMTGPRMGTTPSQLYVGYRSRDLPFSVAGEIVPERFYSAGAGLPLSGPRVVLDLALQRATRGPVAGVSESAWIVSLGFTVRP
ncbi:MAG TPA: hypothetical protein VF981_15115 [Gemmatimonadaceae bacterium]